jgi:hypothetical protein
MKLWAQRLGMAVMLVAAAPLGLLICWYAPTWVGVIVVGVCGYVTAYGLGRERQATPIALLTAVLFGLLLVLLDRW